MNKRQKKKHEKKVLDRYVRFSKFTIYIGNRRSGKSHFQEQLVKAIHSKKYKPFEEIMKPLDKH